MESLENTNTFVIQAKAGGDFQQPKGWSSILTLTVPKMDPGFRRDDEKVELESRAKLPSFMARPAKGLQATSAFFLGQQWAFAGMTSLQTSDISAQQYSFRMCSPLIRT